MVIETAWDINTGAHYSRHCSYLQGLLWTESVRPWFFLLEFTEVVVSPHMKSFSHQNSQ